METPQEVRADAPGSAVVASSSSERSLAGFNTEGPEAGAAASPAREASGNEAPENEAPEHRRLKQIPNGSTVRVLANNRNTKGEARKWIGHEAIVVSSQSMGGWHTLRRADGELVKLQRNSLVVITLGDGPVGGASPVRGGGGDSSPRKRPKRCNADSDESPKKRAKRTNAVADTGDSSRQPRPQRGTGIEPGAAFAKFASATAVQNYASAHHLVLGLPQPQQLKQLKQQCCDHFRQGEFDVDDTDAKMALLYAVQAVLLKQQQQGKDNSADSDCE